MTSETVTIEVDDLRAIVSALLDAIATRFGPLVTLCERGFWDHYWTLEVSAAYGLADNPERHITAGQTSDDVEELRGVLSRNGDDIVLWHDLDHLAALLRRIAFLDLAPDGQHR